MRKREKHRLAGKMGRGEVAKLSIGWLTEDAFPMGGEGGEHVRKRGRAALSGRKRGRFHLHHIIKT